jgi:hypothetical protein
MNSEDSFDFSSIGLMPAQHYDPAMTSVRQNNAILSE